MLEQGERLAIAGTILQQLGGNKFKVMTGAKNFTAMINGGLSFRLPSRFAKDGVNHVTVQLTPSDTYRLMFCKVNWKAMTCKTVAVVEDIYNDNLQEVFTRYTGLDTHL